MTQTPIVTAVIDPERERTHAPLARTMGFFALVTYGVGDMLGAGVYGLVGKAAGIMGNAVWLAFAGAMVAAILTGLSYACIGSRYPRAAGAAYVTHRAYGVPFISYLVGLAVTASGITSMAAGANVIAGYLGMVGPRAVIVVAFLALTALIVWRGMRESTWTNILCTAIEVSGLLIVIAVGLRYWGSVNYLETPAAPGGGASGLAFGLVLNGAVLTFYSFIGFEDILNVAEEVKEPRRTIPLGLITAMLIATAIYMAISITAVSVVPHAVLARSGAPLVDVVKRAAPSFPTGVFTAISVFAVANTALLNFVMGSRMLYGMSRQGMLPAMFGRVDRKRHTPHVAIAILLAIVLCLAVPFNVQPLADATSLLLVTVFVIVNIALIVLKRRPEEPRGAFEVPIIVPLLGAIVCAAMVVGRVTLKGANHRAPLIAIAMVAVIAVLYVVLKPKSCRGGVSEGHVTA